MNNYYKGAMNYYMGKTIYANVNTKDLVEANMIKTLRATIYVYFGIHKDNTGGATSYNRGTDPSTKYFKFNKAKTPSGWKHTFWKII